jgi:hypothetical protein
MSHDLIINHLLFSVKSTPHSRDSVLS